jgi:hypothetical protein
MANLKNMQGRARRLISTLRIRTLAALAVLALAGSTLGGLCETLLEEVKSNCGAE